MRTTKAMYSVKAVIAVNAVNAVNAVKCAPGESGGDAMTASAGPTPDAAEAGGLAPGPRGGPARIPLGRAACLALLAPGGHGRVAATMRAVPIIVPVSFTLIGEDVAFSPGLGEGLTRAIANSVIAFEADEVLPDGRRHWEVHVTGVARKLVHGAAASSFRLSSEIIVGSQTLPLRPSAL